MNSPMLCQSIGEFIVLAFTFVESALEEGKNYKLSPSILYHNSLMFNSLFYV